MASAGEDQFPGRDFELDEYENAERFLRVVAAEAYKAGMTSDLRSAGLDPFCLRFDCEWDDDDPGIALLELPPELAGNPKRGMLAVTGCAFFTWPYSQLERLDKHGQISPAFWVPRKALARHRRHGSPRVTEGGEAAELDELFWGQTRVAQSNLGLIFSPPWGVWNGEELEAEEWSRQLRMHRVEKLMRPDLMVPVHEGRKFWEPTWREREVLVTSQSAAPELLEQLSRGKLARLSTPGEAARTQFCRMCENVTRLRFDPSNIYAYDVHESDFPPLHRGAVLELQEWGLDLLMESTKPGFNMWRVNEWWRERFEGSSHLKMIADPAWWTLVSPGGAGLRRAATRLFSEPLEGFKVKFWVPELEAVPFYRTEAAAECLRAIQRSVVRVSLLSDLSERSARHQHLISRARRKTGFRLLRRGVRRPDAELDGIGRRAYELKAQGLPVREIARRLSVHRRTAYRYIERGRRLTDSRKKGGA